MTTPTPPPPLPYLKTCILHWPYVAFIVYDFTRVLQGFLAILNEQTRWFVKRKLSCLPPHIRVSGFRNPGLWDPEFNSRKPESRQRLESGIQAALTTKNLETSTWNPKSTTCIILIIFCCDNLTEEAQSL